MELKQLIDKYQHLSPELQKAAKYLIDNPQDVVIFSMRTLAKKANVKTSTLLRLAKQLGLDSWLDLKASFVDNLGLKNEDYSQKARYLVKTSHGNPIYQEIALINKNNIDKTTAINQTEIALAASILDQSQSVYIVGFRASFPIAYYLYYVYRLFKKEVYLIDGNAGNVEIFTREMTSNDVVITIGFDPCSQETVNISHIAKKHQCKIVTITDSKLSPLVFDADVSLYFSVDSASFFPSIVSGAIIVESLLASLMTLQGEETMNKLENVEKYFSETGAYIYQQNK